MPAKYKISYFDIRGKGELPRLIFAAAGKDFEDERLSGDKWTAFKPSKRRWSGYRGKQVGMWDKSVKKVRLLNLGKRQGKGGKFEKLQKKSRFRKRGRDIGWR
ncbi:Hypothetical predicted protein [Mytilus galloprovincialis]|uniref:GST N-terminal domain-containing protein n=1 Tax=Mytilus galloprovincialis TaxID=29158 RepID=A0A8B6GZC0_MYTGA|nr:Hypothetical predicted protein [Mytilus galloprovincialis]